MFIVYVGFGYPNCSELLTQGCKERALSKRCREIIHCEQLAGRDKKKSLTIPYTANQHKQSDVGKLTWLVLGGDPAARSHRVEQFTAL